MTINCMQIASSFSIPYGEDVKESALSTSANLSATISQACLICLRTSFANYLSNIYAVSDYMLLQNRIHLFPQPYNIHSYMKGLLNILLNIG